MTCSVRKRHIAYTGKEGTHLRLRIRPVWSGISILPAYKSGDGRIYLWTGKILIRMHWIGSWLLCAHVRRYISLRLVWGANNIFFDAYADNRRLLYHIRSDYYEGALGPITLLFLLIVISKFRLTISKFRHNKSKFRLNNAKFRLNNSKFRHKISKFRLNNSKFRLNILKFRLIISKFQHDISSWFFVCNSTPGNLVRGSRWLCKMKVFPAIWTMKYLFNISNKTHFNLRLLWNTQDVKFP